MTLEATEKECAAVAVAPRVALQDIENDISERYDFRANRAIEGMGWTVGHNTPTTVLSICLLVMRNGFTVIGKSAPASVANFNEDLGKKLAYEDCIRQLWPLLGFQLRTKLHEASQE